MDRGKGTKGEAAVDEDEREMRIGWLRLGLAVSGLAREALGRPA